MAEFHELCFLFKELKTSLGLGAFLNFCLGHSCQFTCPLVLLIPAGVLLTHGNGSSTLCDGACLFLLLQAGKLHFCRAPA